MSFVTGLVSGFIAGLLLGVMLLERPKRKPVAERLKHLMN
jgi:hypothetical protein